MGCGENWGERRCAHEAENEPVHMWTTWGVEVVQLSDSPLRRVGSFFALRSPTLMDSTTLPSGSPPSSIGHGSPTAEVAIFMAAAAAGRGEEGARGRV